MTTNLTPTLSCEGMIVKQQHANLPDLDWLHDLLRNITTYVVASARVLAIQETTYKIT
jgi:hypothetical protein